MRRDLDDRLSHRFSVLGRRVGFSLLAAIALAQLATASEPTSVVIEGVIYGAVADERGPIGGGSGYKALVTRGDFTAATLDDLLEALNTAKAGDVVFLPGEVEIDLTARIYIDKLVLELPAGVTLAGDRGVVENGKVSQGAILTSDALNTPVMIRSLGPGARIAGLRLRGPNTKRYLEHHKRSLVENGAAFRDYFYKFPVSSGVVTSHDRLEVDNCEISGFAHAGINLRSGVNHHIHHCYIHHCQYQGLGYGVCHDQAVSLIERCLFDWNRHSIAGTGRPTSGYTAAHNVELGESLSHCFDMHGGRDRGDGTNTAGTHLNIRNNTFRASPVPIRIRGVPEELSQIQKNWFPNCSSPAEAVEAEKNTAVRKNAFGRANATVVK